VDLATYAQRESVRLQNSASIQPIRANDIIVPALLPDELVHGWLGRISSVNILHSTNSSTALLEAAFLTQEEQKANGRRVLAISRAAGMSVEHFCQQHTLMPFLRATTNYYPEFAHGAAESAAAIKRSALCLAMDTRLVCPECIAEDLSFWGFTYWRRRHQLPGILCCDKHQTKLIAVSQNFDVCPSASGDYAETRSNEMPADCTHNALVSRYAEIASGFLEIRKPLSCKEAAKKLSQRSRHLGIRVAQKGRRPLLSDIALDTAPRGWIASLFPRVETKKPGEIFPPIDRAVVHEGLPHARALALSLLFDTAEEALQYWSGPLKSEGDGSKNTVLIRQNLWGSKKALDAYVISEGNLSDTAKTMGASVRTASEGLDKWGLPTLAGIHLETTGRAVVAFFDGLPLAEACAIHGAEQMACESLIRRTGVRFARALRRILKKHPAVKSSAPIKGRERDRQDDTQKPIAGVCQSRAPKEACL
jgi:hypothetical protein